MKGRSFGIALLMLGLGVSPALGQTPSQPAGGGPLVSPTGVGGCIYRALPLDVRRNALVALMSHQDISTVLRGPVAAVAERCTGRSYSASDTALVGAIMSVFSRLVAAFFLNRQLGIPERQLYEAWTGASPTEKAPFLASAQSFLSPSSAFAKPSTDAVAPFEQRLQLAGKSTDPKVPEALNMYYSATALSELAEAALATKSARPGM